MIKNNKGITLIALVVTIIILLILAVTGFYYGDLSVESSKFERLSSQMQTMQLKLNQLYEEKSEIDITGEDVAESNDSFSVVEKKNIEIGNKSDYKSYTYVQVEEIFGIKDVEQDLRFLINFKKRRVIIDGGYTYDNTTYYVIEDFKDVFNVDYNGFKYDVKDGIGNSTITISDAKVGIKLPDEYQQVEYIGTTIGQYIETDIVPKVGYDFKFSNVNVTDSTGGALFVSTNSNGDPKITLAYSTSTNMGFYKYFTSGNASQISLSDMKGDIVIKNDGTYIANNKTIVDEVSKVKGNVNTNLVLFKAISGNFGSVYIGENDTPIFYGQPCYRKSDDVVGLYDVVNNRFYGIIGTGQKIRGNDVEKPNVNKIMYKKKNENEWILSRDSNKIVIGEKGTYSLKVELLDGKIIEYDNVEVNPIEAAANSPELTEEMIPVTWNRERLSWIKADKDNLDNSWYNYNKDSNMWANVITVNQNGTYSREFYQNAEIGTEILMSDINGMFVWIPRFTYNATIDENNKITTVDGIRYSNDIDDNVSYSKEGIDFGEAKGIWVSKFECSNDSNGNLNVKPNVNSVKNIVYNGENGAYTISQSLTTDNNIYGFDSGKISSDIIKDSDWEAVAILSKGVTSNAMIYNNSYFEGNKDNVAITRTGMVGIGAEGSENTSTTETSFEKIIKTENTGKISLGNAKNFYEYWTNEGQKASTTQNVYGIYDMSGGGSEYVQKEEDKVWIRGGTFSVYEDILEGASEGEQNKSYSDVSFRVILTVK